MAIVCGGAQLLTPVQEARMSIEAAPYKVDTLAVSNQARRPHAVPCRRYKRVMDDSCECAQAQVKSIVAGISTGLLSVQKALHHV